MGGSTRWSCASYAPSLSEDGFWPPNRLLYIDSMAPVCKSSYYLKFCSYSATHLHNSGLNIYLKPVWSLYCSSCLSQRPCFTELVSKIVCFQKLNFFRPLLIFFRSRTVSSAGKKVFCSFESRCLVCKIQFRWDHKFRYRGFSLVLSFYCKFARLACFSLKLSRKNSSISETFVHRISLIIFGFTVFTARMLLHCRI